MNVEHSPLRRGRFLAILALIALASISAQLAFRSMLPAEASLAGANGLSASLGLANGRGMTIAVSEGMAIKRTLGGDEPIASVFDPEADRLPLIEPLPGPVLVFYLLSAVGLTVTLNLISFLNILILAIGAVVLAYELGHRGEWFGILAAMAIAGFVPMYRMTIVAGYDMYEFLCLIVGVTALLKYERTNKIGWLIANSVFMGLGLWMRSYFFLYAAVHAVIVMVLLRGRETALRPTVRRAVAWVLPLVILAGFMVSVRDSGSTGTLLTRGAFWHMFWMGVGQFDNDEIEGASDWDSCELAKRLGHPIPCDSEYESVDQPYLFQYDRGYNALLREHAIEYIEDHPGRLAANAVHRVFWLILPGTMPSSRIEARPVLRMASAGISFVVLSLAVIGFLSMRRRQPRLTLILIGTFVALLPLVPYYVSAKVVAIPYFCVLALAAGGGVQMIKGIQRRL